MEHYLDEKSFNSAFGKRLKWVREQMGASRTKFAKRLGITADQLKRYETRESSGFPLYLLPELIDFTLEPYAFWMGEEPSKHWRFRVVK